MIQLKVYDTPAKETQYWIDLYETEPIKLTLSIEDITNADATSVFSRTFKVPGTRKNAEFFKNSFDVDGVMYDVTVKKPAEILVDGAEFRQGHVRLQRVFVNTELDRVDYELLFLGETRDFSSIIGDKGLCELDLPDLIGGQTGAANDFVGPEDIVLSWQAYPQTASLTNGLHDGNIIYPLIDHGNTYEEDGTIVESRIAIGNSSANTPNFTQGSGTNNTNPRRTLSVDRIKPMIRAKRLIDQIFEDAGYTYTSSFFDSDLFHQIYISAFGNEAVVSLASDNGAGSENTAYGDNQNQTQHTYDRLTFPNNQVDPGNNISQPSTSPYGSIYEAPGAGTYTITARCYYEGCRENSDYTCSNIRGSLVIRNYSTSQDLAVGTLGSGGGSTLTVTATGVPLATGDIVGIYVTTENSTDFDLVNNVVFEVTSAPGRYTPANGLDCQYKQIDFVKDILTSFRLVLSPDVNDPKNFIIEPWQTYINSGELYDWSKKLVEDKDVVIEPVFFSQSDVIDFKFQPGGDYTNIYHQQSFEKPYGYLEFSSGNDLLKGTREIKLLGIAPTELVNIQGASATDFVPIPQLHTHSSEDTGLQHLPIRPKTRMLFYNGLQPFTVPGNAHDGWYIQNDPTKRTVYPLVSPYETWPITDQSLNLNFANDVQYWGTRAGYNDTGVTLYENYWSRYIASLYNKYSRRVTANFILNNIDLNTFSFDDTVFVNGTYYRPEKIIDVEVGAYTEVKVQLLTANDYRPSVIPDQVLDIISVTGNSGGCLNLSGQIDVVTNGTPGFTWTLSNGVSGTALAGAPVGQAPYSFSIYGVAAGTYTITITDSVGRSDSTTVTVPIGFETLPAATQVVNDATDCTAPCNGSATVTPTGGQAPYTIQWNDEVVPGTNFSRTDLCPGQYDYVIYDANGCSSAYYLVEVGCNTEGNTVWYYAEDLNCQQLSSQFVKVEVPAGTTPDPVNDVVGLSSISTGQGIPGCYRPVYQTTGTPDYNLAVYWQDCESCQGIEEYYYNIAEYEPAGTCTVGGTLNQRVKSNAPIAIGTTVKLTNITSEFLSPTTCYEIVYEIPYPIATEADVATIYESCESCQGITPDSYYIVLDCAGEAAAQTVRFTVPVTIGEVWQLDGGPVDTCWQIVDLGSEANWSGLTGVTGFFNCADCQGDAPTPSGFYRLLECGTEANPVYWTVPQELYAFNIDDTVQFTKNVDPSIIWCGTIKGIYENQVADATLFSAQTYGCDDTLHCIIDNPNP